MLLYTYIACPVCSQNRNKIADDDCVEIIISRYRCGLGYVLKLIKFCELGILFRIYK